MQVLIIKQQNENDDEKDNNYSLFGHRSMHVGV